MKIQNPTLQRKMRISRKVRGTEQKPRLSIFRSNHQIFVQLIDDVAGKTIIGASEKHLENAKGAKTAKAKALGIIIAAKALEKKISHVVFDKGSYKYHG